ncbi:(2Fe-2S)-binding protein, partial [Burkholderia vietnamiensis]|nr:(2Fe-2S)-binding protein [Burkholderia vietnamiensis]
MSTDRSDSSSAEPGRAASRAPLGEGRPAPSQPADTPSSAARRRFLQSAAAAATVGAAPHVHAP